MFYFPEDIAQSLTAGVLLAVKTHLAEGERNCEFLRGILTMGQYTATAFGLSWPAVIGEVRESLGAGCPELTSGGGTP